MDNFSKMYETWFDRLVPVAAAVLNGDTAGAEDIVQDVFVKLCEKKIEIRNPESYLMQAITREAINELHRRTRRGIILDTAI